MEMPAEVGSLVSKLIRASKLIVRDSIKTCAEFDSFVSSVRGPPNKLVIANSMKFYLSGIRSSFQSCLFRLLGAESQPACKSCH